MSRRNLRASVCPAVAIFITAATATASYASTSGVAGPVAYVTNDLVAAEVLRGEEKGHIPRAAGLWNQ
ncbi:MAG: hypothetical protein M3377_02625 [Actinomycetota bacterium]|nr:hypothetical protein [Actinomycetota bacterium]